MEQSRNNQSQTSQPPPVSSNTTVPLSFIQNILANIHRTQPQVSNGTPSNHHSHTTGQALSPDEALPQAVAKNIDVIDLDDQSIGNVPANIDMNENHVGQEMQIIQQVQEAPLIEQGQIINKPGEIPFNNCQKPEKIIQQEKPKETNQVISSNQISLSQSQKINSSELRQHIQQIPIEISSIPQAPSISILQSAHNNQHNNHTPSLSIGGETLPAQQIVNVEMETNRSPLANITNSHPSYAFRGISNFIDSTIPNVIQIIEQRPTPDFNAQAASNQQAHDNSQNLPPLVLPNPEMEITQMDIQIPEPQPQQPEANQIAQQGPEPPVQNNGQVIEIIEDQPLKLVHKVEQNHQELIQVSHIEKRQVESSNIPNIQENLTENGQKQNNVLESGEVNLCEVQNLNINQPKQIQIIQQMNPKSQTEQINQKQIVIIEESPQEQQIQDKKPQISANQPINGPLPNQLQLQFPSICNDSPQLTDINEIRKLLLTYLPPHLQELTQSLDDRQLRQMYLDIRAEQMKLSAQNVQNPPISQNAENTNNIIHIQQNPVQISKKPAESESLEDKKKQAPKPAQPKKVAKSNQPSLNQAQPHRRQERKDVTFNITQISETHNNQGKTADSNKKGKKMKKQRKRIVTTVVQQVEYFDDSDNETPSKYTVLQNGETKRKKPVNKAQMQSILTQLCSLVKSLDLASVGSNTTQ